MWTASSSDSCPLTCLVWVALSEAYDKVSIALQIIMGHANLLTVRREKVAVLEEINLLLTQICSLKSQSLSTCITEHNITNSVIHKNQTM